MASEKASARGAFGNGRACIRGFGPYHAQGRFLKSCRLTCVIDEASPLVLGSSSPRRRDILATLRIPFVVASAEIDEDVKEGETPDAYLERIVLAKLSAISKVAAGMGRALLVADTTVLVEGEILGKPRDAIEAEQMLARLSGREHQVATRFAIADLEAPEPVASAHEETVVTRVFFRSLSPSEIRRYAATGEGFDKAGGYAIQGIGSFAVARIDGSYPNVVGLPACEVVLALETLGLLGPFPR